METIINTICVCGAGTMGSGIAQCAAQHGYYTLLFDVNENTLAQARIAIEKSLQTLAEKQKITTDQHKLIQQRIRYIHDVQECLADVIIEAIIEKLPIKIALLNQLAEINHGETIFASNTSSLSVTEIAKGVLHPHRVIGMHFFNPATIMKLVEVVETDFTDKKVTETIIQLCLRLSKTPVRCKDAPGFIVNRVARHYYLEALKLIENGWSNYENIDTLMEASGFKMGPFKLMDLIGNDINYAVSCSVYEQLGKPERLKPSPIQKETVDSGKLGRKTGEGYYKY
jgi:3-hydroxybutyryl-CoA dehydrogenase